MESLNLKKYGKQQTSALKNISKYYENYQYILQTDLLIPEHSLSPSHTFRTAYPVNNKFIRLWLGKKK